MTMNRGYLAAALAALFLVLPSGLADAQSRTTLPLTATDYSVTGATPTTSIYYDVSINTYQALTSSIGFTDKENTQKLNVAPFKIRSDLRSCDWYCDAALNVTQKGGVYTFGVGWGYNSAAPYSRRNERVANGLSDQIAPPRDQRPGETDEEYDGYLRRYRQDALRTLYTSYWESLIRNSWQLRVTGNVQSFGVITGSRVDLNGDGKLDNQYRVKGWDVGVGGAFAPNLRSGVSASLHHTRKRASAVEGQRLARYYGGTVTGARQIAELDRNYRDSEAYRKRLFIPSVWLGASLEHQRCANDVVDCEDRVERQTVFTPYVDLKIAPEAQFRLGLPFRRTRVAPSNELTAAPTFQLGFQMGGF